MKDGFTLSELLVALAILATLATFTIPKILSSSEDSQKRAVFREVIGSFYAMLGTGRVLQDLEGTNQTQYFFDHLNTAKTCSGNSSTQGCWDTPTQGTVDSQENQPGVILHNGARVVGLNSFASVGNAIAIDWNGTDGPNTLNEDQILLYICIGPGSCAVGQMLGTGPKVPGAIAPYSTGGAAGVTLWEWIFQ